MCRNGWRIDCHPTTYDGLVVGIRQEGRWVSCNRNIGAVGFCFRVQGRGWNVDFGIISWKRLQVERFQQHFLGPRGRECTFSNFFGWPSHILSGGEGLKRDFFLILKMAADTAKLAKFRGYTGRRILYFLESFDPYTRIASLGEGKEVRIIFTLNTYKCAKIYIARVPLVCGKSKYIINDGNEVASVRSCILNCGFLTSTIVVVLEGHFDYLNSKIVQIVLLKLEHTPLEIINVLYTGQQKKVVCICLVTRLFLCIFGRLIRI